MSEVHNLKIAKLLIAPLAISLSMFVGSDFTANAAEVGSAKRVKNTVIGSQGKRRLSAKDPVFTGETIRARKNSHGELLLKDKTKVVIGENSSVSLDNFAVSKGGVKKGTLKLTKGALRLITGNGVKSNTYKVRTRNATIGARGTGFDVYVRPNGTTDVVLIQGRVNVCSSSGCRLVRANCGIVRVSGGGGISTLPFLRSDVKNRASEDANYNLFANQGRFAGGWRLPTIGCIAKRSRPFFERERKRRDAKSDETQPTPPDKPQVPDVTPPTSDPCAVGLSLARADTVDVSADCI